MCTLIVLHRCVRGMPLVVAANRDEFLDRPSEGLAVRADLASRSVLAPLDCRAGGTWLGLNPKGVFAAVTNRPCSELDPERSTRGRIVMDALGARSAEEAAKQLSQLPAETYNPFNALVADAQRAFVVEYQDAPALCELAPGAHVVGNAAPDDRSVGKVDRILGQALDAAELPAEQVTARLAGILREHECAGERGPLDDTCVHAGPYGTRSSLLLELEPTFSKSRLLYADGAPCETDYNDSTSLLHELTQRACYAVGESPTRKAT